MILLTNITINHEVMFMMTVKSTIVMSYGLCGMLIDEQMTKLRSAAAGHPGEKKKICNDNDNIKEG